MLLAAHWRMSDARDIASMHIRSKRCNAPSKGKRQEQGSEVFQNKRCMGGNQGGETGAGNQKGMVEIGASINNDMVLQLLEIDAWQPGRRQEQGTKAFRNKRHMVDFPRCWKERGRVRWCLCPGCPPLSPLTAFATVLQLHCFQALLSPLTSFTTASYSSCQKGGQPL
eukprot:1141551-Pelagomonas_calceolata.AAC.3